MNLRQILRDWLLQTPGALEVDVEIIRTRCGNLLKGPTPFPRYATAGSAGLDLHADLFITRTVLPGEVVKISTGVKLNIRSKGVVGLVFPRSGKATKEGAVLANGVGVIDSDYQGEIIVALTNRSDTPFLVQPGERIAQLVFVPLVHARLTEVATFAETTKRGENGFGSTGSVGLTCAPTGAA